MRFRHKSRFDRVVGTVQHSLAAVGDARPTLPEIDTGKAKTGLIAAGGLAGLTAGSAAVSSLRRRIDGTRGNS